MGEGEGTNGGARVTSGGVPVPPWLAIAGFAAVALVQGTVNVFSTLSDRAGTGVAAWEIWTWELTSIAVLFALAPLIWIAVARLRPPRLSWPAAIATLAALSLPASIVHVTLMVALRKLIYALRGGYYPFGPDVIAEFLYEYRKDIATFILFALVFALFQWILSRPSVIPATAPAKAMLTIRDGATSYQVPVEEIDYLAAAGNYVEVHWGGRTLLHRTTLAAIESELAGSGFVRVHRSILVRRDAIRQTETGQSGDFTLTLSGGETIKGSRRYRPGLQS